MCKTPEQKSKHLKDHQYGQKKRLSVETEADKQARLKKVSEYNKRKQSLETDRERQIRLQKLSESIKQKRTEETDSERQIRLQKDSESKKRKRSDETDTNRQMRLEKDRLYKKQKRTKSVLQAHREVVNQEVYLIFRIGIEFDTGVRLLQLFTQSFTPFASQSLQYKQPEKCLSYYSDINIIHKHLKAFYFLKESTMYTTENKYAVNRVWLSLPVSAEFG